MSDSTPASDPGSAPIARWLADPLSPESARAVDRIARLPEVERVVVLPDVHPSGAFCVGTVVASRGRVFPAAVGSDIGCGMSTVRFAATARELLGDRARAEKILTAFATLVPSDRHRSKGARPVPLPELPPDLAEGPPSDPRLAARARREAPKQLGTLGRGNHFLELQEDEEGALWAMVHSGSRGIGQAISGHHGLGDRRSASGGKSDGFAADSDHGRAYLDDVAWARRYASASRRAMLTAVEVLFASWFAIEVEAETFLDCDHNHVARETHDGIDLWVHRKGALPAHAGLPGVIPGSMGTWSAHVVGRGNPASLASCSHGAGRVMARGEAARRISPRAFVASLERAPRGAVFFDRGIERRLVEEAPAAYRDLDAVMRAQHDLTRLVRRVYPRLVHKGV